MSRKTNRPKRAGRQLSLKGRAALLEHEVDRLRVKLDTAYRKIAELEGSHPEQSMDDLVREFDEKQEEQLRKEIAEAEQEEKKIVKERQRYPGHGPREQPNLPVEEKVIELAQDEKTCPVCQGELEPLGDQYEESEEIGVRVRSYFRRKLKRRKYRCRCNSCVVTAPAPPRIIPGGRYAEEVILQVATDKYLEHVPLERQARQMRQLGLDVLTQTLFDQADGLANFLFPIYRELGRSLFEEALIHADETRWPRLDSSELANWVVWTRTTPRIAHYSILESKSTNAAKSLFTGFKGVILADGYQVYKKLASEDPNLRLANCWAHVIRKFIEIRGNFPTACDKAIALIQDLYAVEAKVEGPFPGNAEAREARRKSRSEESAPILEAIKSWAENETALPNSELGKAIRYLLKRWQPLTLFLDNPVVPLDNNAAERSLRGPVVGRKVHYGSKSKRGTEVAAILYTILETAKLHCRNPAAYLQEAVQHLHQGKLLMPWDYQAPAEEPPA